MRGKENLGNTEYSYDRITPAYAGKRPFAVDETPASWDHPRLCGEKEADVQFLFHSLGSPPPMRGKEELFYKNLLTFWHNTVILKLFQGEKGRNDLRITHEADYAIRVTYCLALAGEKQCAKDISEVTGVTLRFALKILRKLTQSGITKSYKGVAGGYELNHSPSEISLGAIIECIDGPIAINHCLANEFQCTHMGTQKECDFHRVFSEINRSLRDQLCSITMDRFLPPQK